VNTYEEQSTSIACMGDGKRDKWIYVNQITRSNSQRGWPSGSRRHSGVVVVLQFVQTGVSESSIETVGLTWLATASLTSFIDFLIAIGGRE
jgi:hypothetical protein